MTLEQLLKDFSIAVLPGQKLTISQGDIVRINVGFNYRGPAISCTLRCSIGQRRLGVFDEIAYRQTIITLPESFDFLAYTAFADVDTSSIEPGTNYDMEAKIQEYPETLVGIDNVIDIRGAAEFQGFAITGYEKT